jgi:hypothetical protein
MEMTGLYYITTNDIYGELVRWVLNIPYNIIGFQIASTLPNEDQYYVYFLDLFTLKPPGWISSCVSLKEWTQQTLYKTKNITYLSFQYFINPTDGVFTDIKTLIKLYCLPASSSSTMVPPTAHWKAMVTQQWHPYRHFSLFIADYPMSSTIILFNDTSPIKHTHDFSIFLSLLMEHNGLKPSNPGPVSSPNNNTNTNTNTINNNNNGIVKSSDVLLTKQIQGWLTTIEHHGTPIVFLHDLVEAVDPSIVIPKEGSYTAVIVCGKDHMMYLPEKMSDTLLSLSNPDISLLSQDEKNILRTMLCSSEYLNDTKYDLVREALR